MGIHPFQIADLNFGFLGPNVVSFTEGSTASEFAVVPDNLNANLSRYLKLQAAWANIAIGATVATPQSDSYGQSTGFADQLVQPTYPYRPNGGYFIRGLYFTNTAIPSNDSTGPYRVGYIGSFVGGMLNIDYVHDPNGNPPTVDYEPIYSHGAVVFPVTASAAKEWRDAANPPSDGTDAIVNSSSALTRTAYMPASYMLFYIDSVGSNMLSSGNVSFHFENRPTLRMAGYNDFVGNAPFASAWAGASITAAASTAYNSDPLRAQGILTSAATDNFHEYYQVSGVRKLNSRGLSFHLAKVYDNGFACFAYPFEEDGITLGTGASVIGSSIQYPYTYVNDQQQYVWAGGRDIGASVLSTSVTSNVVTIQTTTQPSPYATGSVILIQGLTVHTELNGALLTVLAGATTTIFTANWAHANYASVADNGIVVLKPDFRIKQNATFIINEEYYGFVADTKCTIWSNKSSMFPLVFFDLADTWTGSTAKRIAGVSVVPTYINATQTLSYQIFFLSEDGMLARYDFTQTNGVLELAGVGSFTPASSAPAPAAAGEAYGSFHARSTSSPITNVAINGSNVLTVLCVNTFEVGEVINLQGLTTATFLNNQTVTVATVSGTQFTATYMHALYASAADTGTAVGYSLWAVYGTMYPDPRIPQLALVNTARVGVIRYLIGTGVWGSVQYSPLTGRHNGRSLSEMIVARDSKLYLLVEDVTVTGAFNVFNAFAAPATITATTITGTNLLTVTAVNTYSAGDVVRIVGTAETQINGLTGTVAVAGLSGTQFEINLAGTWANYSNGADTGTAERVSNVNWQVMAVDAAIPTAVVWNNNGKINGSTLLQYGTNMGPNGVAQVEFQHFWFMSINAALHDLGLNRIVVQPNWTAGDNTTAGITSVGLQALDVSGSTSTLANANLATIMRGTVLPNDSQVGPGGGQTDPSIAPATIVHARDFATNAERTIFWLNDLNRTNYNNWGLYLAPPSFSWSAPSALTDLPRNVVGGNPQATSSYQKDYWTCGFTQNYLGNFAVRYAWQFPTMLTDNYVHYINGCSGTDSLPNVSTYGRSFGQGMGFLPTYWKYTGGNWKMADNYADAVANPYLVPNANVDVPLPYGLKVQFGPLGSTSYSQNEFHTFNMAWGNTKFARKMRQSYAQFAGQTFTNVDTRTIASQNALSMFLIDTDLGTVTNTAPTSATPHTAVLTTPNLGWITQTTWPKLDPANLGHDATPFTTVWNANTNAFDTASYAFPSANNVTGSTPGPYTWVQNSLSYVVQASSEQDSVNHPAWQAVSGNPQTYWASNTGGTGIIYIDVNTAKTVNTYGFRPLYSAVDTLDTGTPKNWTLDGSTALTLAAAIGGAWVNVDTRTNVTSYNRGAAFTASTPASYRFYRLNITATQSGTVPTVSMLRLNTAAFLNTVNFSELVFYAYGSHAGANYHYEFIRNWQMARGIKLEISTNLGVNYTTVFDPGVTSPLWRALNGYVWTFPRQTLVTNVRITVRHGYNYNTTPNLGNQAATTGFGPFYFIDYGVAQATIDAARLGTNSLTPPDPRSGSFDANCLGIATDVPNISIDGGNPSLIQATNLLINSAVHGFWDFNFVPDAAHSTSATPNFKMHPFFGFIFFQGAGADGSVSTQTGTNAVINYQWGRRV